MGETKVNFAHDWEPGYRPSNGTEGDIFRAQWCDRCDRDHGMHNGNDQGPGCDIICDAMFGEHSYPNPDGPPQWERCSDREGRYLTRCTEFVDCGPCAELKEAEREKIWPTGPADAWKPAPVKAIPGQIGMFDG